MRPSYFRLRETTFDLYTEAERLPWYFKACSTLAAWMVLAGYILFAIASTSPPDDLRVFPSTISALAATLIFIGYISDLILALIARSLLFAFDGVILPIFTASVVGIFAIAINRVLHLRSDTHTSPTFVLLPLTTAVLATITSGAGAIIIYRKLQKIKHLDARRRSHLTHHDFQSPHSTLDTPMLTPGLGTNTNTKNKRVEDMVPDDEAQRRQLLRLLLSRDQRKPSDADPDPSSTYHIDLPWETPGSTTAPRTRSASQPNQKTATKQPLLGGAVKITFRGRDRSDTAGSGAFKDPRQRRREEIERSSVPPGQAARAAEPGTSSFGWYGRGHSPEAGRWTGGGGRYA